jgi:hypothetical protein
LRLINAGDTAGDVVEVRSGLISGDRVISTIPPMLTDGAPVSAGSR